MADSHTHGWEVRDKVPSALSLAKSPCSLFCFLCQVSPVLCPCSSEIAPVLLTFDFPDSPGQLAGGSQGVAFMFQSSFTLKAKHEGASARGSLQGWTSKMGSAFVCNLSRLKRRQVGWSWGHFQNSSLSQRLKKKKESQGAVLNSPPCSCYQGRGGLCVPEVAPDMIAWVFKIMTWSFSCSLFSQLAQIELLLDCNIMDKMFLLTLAVVSWSDLKEGSKVPIHPEMTICTAFSKQDEPKMAGRTSVKGQQFISWTLRHNWPLCPQRKWCRGRGEWFPWLQSKARSAPLTYSQFHQDAEEKTAKTQIFSPCKDFFFHKISKWWPGESREHHEERRVRECWLGQVLKKHAQAAAVTKRNLWIDA